MVLKIHHLGHSQSDRVVWLCEELNLTYDLIKYTRDPILSPPTLKALHPLGAAPVIEDIDNNDKGNNIKLAETEACFEYILNIHGGGEGKGKKFLVKPGEENYADFLYFYHLTNGTLQPAVGRVMALRMAKVSEEEATLQRFLAKVHQVLGVLEERLGEVPYLAGKEFTAADMMVVFTLTTMREFVALDLSSYSNLLAYVKKLVARPAYQRYLQKADPDIEIEKYINGPPPPKFAAFK